MMKILCILGTRPEAVKMAPVIRELGKHRDRIESHVCITGQHRHMVDPILDLFQIKPDFDLNVMEAEQSLARLTSTLLTKLDEITIQVKPDWILAQGDTTTVLVASLIAYYHQSRFGHVEAGLRTHQKFSPFPEEMNRRIADQLADLYFAPTESAKLNLLREGVPENKIYVTGNPGIDALLDAANRNHYWESGALSGLPKDKKIILITAHRRESFAKHLTDICHAIFELAVQFHENFHFVFPVHLNPKVRRPVFEILTNCSNISLIDPLDYFSMVQLMKHAYLILTDSGGIQEEAAVLGVPVLVLRETTERTESLECGVSKIVGVETKAIIQETSRILSFPEAHQEMAQKVSSYGDGHAAERIVQIMLESQVGIGEN